MKRFLGGLGQLFSPEQKPTSRKVTRNVIFSGLRGLLTWPIPFLIIPFILAKVGPEGYGIWAVFLTIIKLTAISDAGLGGTLTKYVAEYYASGNFDALNELVDTALMLYFLVAFLVCLALSVTSGRLVPVLFHGVVVRETSLQFLWDCMLAILVFNILAMPLLSIVTGLQRMDLTNLLSSFNALCAAMLVVIFLSLGWALPGLLLAYLIAAVLSLLIYVWMVRRLLPNLRLNPLHARRKEIRKIASFSIQIYVTGVSVAISNEIEKLYLAWFVGVVPVGWYDVASQAALRIRRIPETLLGPVMAAASELDAQREHAKLQELYYRSHKYIAFISVPLLFWLIIVARRLVDLWVGSKLEIIAGPLAVLAAASLFNLTSGPGLLTLVGKGNLKPGVYSSLLAIFLNLTVSFGLIYFRGFSGAVIGTTVALLAGTIFFLVVFRREMGSYSKKSVLRVYLKPVMTSVALASFLVIFAPFDHMGWVGFVAEAAVFGGVYVTALVLAGFFDAFDLDRLEVFLPVARHIRRFIPVA